MKKGVTYDYLIDSRSASPDICNHVIRISQRDGRRTHKFIRKFRLSRPHPTQKGGRE